MITKKKNTFAIRHAAITKWIRDNFDDKPRSTLTSTSLAVMASADLGFPVDGTRMARALDRAGVLFRRTKADPPVKCYSRVDLLIARVDRLEKEVMKLSSHKS